MTEKEKETEEPVQPVILREDGMTFLSRGELDEYREQAILLAWQEGAYA